MLLTKAQASGAALTLLGLTGVTRKVLREMKAKTVRRQAISEAGFPLATSLSLVDLAYVDKPTPSGPETGTVDPYLSGLAQRAEMLNYLNR